jgi:hypothetical protein
MNLGQTFSNICLTDDIGPKQVIKSFFLQQKDENQAYFDVPHL